jgi:phosphoribosylformylglycinamidine synthase
VNNQNLHWQIPLRETAEESVVPEDATETDVATAAKLTSFGSSEYAKVVLGGTWGQPPSLDLAAEANLHKLLVALADSKLLYSARDLSDGGIAVALAQACFPKGIGASAEQDQSLLVHPLFGLFAEVASTMLITAHPDNVSEITRQAGEYNFFAARIGTTGGLRLEISVDHEPFISAPLNELRKPWASALEATLHGEVTA